MKKILALLLVLAMALSMVACSGGKTGGSSLEGIKTDAEPTWDTSKEDEIVVSAMSNYYESGWKMMAEEYMKLHPETTVVIDVVASNDALNQKFVTWFESDDLSEAADITHINFSGVVGGTDLLLERGQAFDFTPVLDMINPYTGEKVRSYLDEGDIARYTTTHGVQALPFDHVSVGIMVNEDLLKDNGLEVPTTMEEFQNCCKVLKEAGIETPILATPEGSYFLGSMVDASRRDQYQDFIVQESDALWDANTMSANIGYTYTPDDFTTDHDIVLSGERVTAYMNEVGYGDDLTVSVWNEYAKLAPYFNANWNAAAATDVLTSFEMQEGAFLVSGSWNVGVLNKDVQDMGEDGFEWSVIGFPDYETKPEGWATGDLRTISHMGNTMGIILTGDEDHTARVLDFYLFCYNPIGCAAMYDNTLENGYFVQGDCAIKGVELPADVTAKLNGFIQASRTRSDLDKVQGLGYVVSEDNGLYNDALNKLATGELDAAGMVATLKPLWEKKLADDIDVNGYDLDPATKDEHK